MKLRKRHLPNTDRAQARLTFLQHEYVAIRAELVSAVSSQQSVMAYGLAAMAVIFTGLLASWTNVGVRTGILGLTPLLLIFVWFVWYGEVQRLLRTRWFLWDLEKKINAQFRVPQPACAGSDLRPADALHWESWVRGRNRWRTNLHSRPAYHLATGLLCGSGLGTTVLSLVLGLTTTGLPRPLLILTLCGAGAFLLLCGYALFVVRTNPLLKHSGKAVT